MTVCVCVHLEARAKCLCLEGESTWMEACVSDCIWLHVCGLGVGGTGNSLRFSMTCLPFLPLPLPVPQVFKATSIPARPGLAP